MTWLVPLVIKSSCNVDATYFPYDEQTCDIYFGSWIYDESQLDLQPFPIEPYLNNYLVNSEFSLLGVTMRRELVDEKCCPGSGSHPMIVVQINIKRKSIYYNYIIIAPTMLLSILSLFSFCLPSHHGDRISIGLTVFLTLYVLQLLISANVPDTNTTPILGILLCFRKLFLCYYYCCLLKKEKVSNTCNISIFRAVVAVNVWYSDLQLLPVQSVSISTEAVSSNPAHGEVHSIQHYTMKFVRNLRQVSDFLRFPLPIKLTTTI